MSHSEIFELLPGAIMVSDVHYSDKRPEFLAFLQAIDSGTITTPQLILMGDIFDLLFGYIPKTQERNTDVIALIKTLSKKMDIIYLEGNHDFQLQQIFPDLHIIPIARQPFTCKFENLNISLAHGDYRGDWKYRLYVALIRSSWILKFLNLIDSMRNNAIIKWLDNYLEDKDDCNVIEAFEAKIASYETLFESYRCDYVIEGHFHQNCMYEFAKFNYINLGAFACNQRYFIVQSSKEQKLLQEVIFNKELI